MTKDEINYALKRTKQIIEFNGYQSYSDYSFICGSSNENHEEIAKILEYKNKSLLTVAGSGEQYLSAKYSGAKNVTLYDINNLSKLYVYLKIGAIKKLNYDDFINFLVPMDNQKYMSLNTLLKISDYLPEYVSEYWYNVLKQYGYHSLEKLILYPTDYNKDDYFTRGAPYYKKENYSELKQLIQNESYPEFIPTSIYNITTQIPSKKFDVIDTSNIIECILSDSWNLDCYSEDTMIKWIKFVEKELTKLLNKNGQIIVDYEPSIFSKELIEHNSFKKYEIESKKKEKSLVLVYKNNGN